MGVSSNFLPRLALISNFGLCFQPSDINHRNCGGHPVVPGHRGGCWDPNQEKATEDPEVYNA